MKSIDKVIKTACKLIDLPYNKFNLDNYLSVLKSHKINFNFSQTKNNLPIKLMSGNDEHSGIVETGLFQSRSKRNIYIVGKGILFDSGGLDLKPPDGTMQAMTDDKAGAIIALIVANYLQGNVIAYCPCTTNLIQTSKITPGDIIKIGKHLVKITNTDAEGRLILAQAISSINQKSNDIIISIATLTGGCSIAVGDRATAIMSDNNDLLKKYAEAAFEAKELAWALPMFDYMQKYYTKEPIRNHIKEFKGSTCQGGMFIKQFVKYPKNFIHLDIASSAFDDVGMANGVPIKSLINFIRKLND